MRMSVTIVVRASTRATLERRSKRLRQRVKDVGAVVRLLRWEQRAGRLAVVLLRYPPSPGRGLPVETGTIAATYPWSAGTLVLNGGVPFGVAASAPVTFTTAAPPRNKNRYMSWCETSGAGKATAGRLVPSTRYVAPLDCSEADAARIIIQKLADGGSGRGIARWLSALGVPAPKRYRDKTGRERQTLYRDWAPDRIWDMGRDSLYRGVRVLHHSGGDIQQTAPALVDEVTWQRRLRPNRP
jgi:hypothetical protein